MTKTNTMDFIESPTKKTSNRKVLWAEFDHLSTPKIVWFLLRRHRMGLVTGWAIIMTVSWAFPPFWSLMGALFGSIVQ